MRKIDDMKGELKAMLPNFSPVPIVIRVNPIKTAPKESDLVIKDLTAEFDPS